MRKSLLALAAVSALAAAPVQAAIDSYLALLYGSNEVANGDPDGFGSALVSIDNLTNNVSWAIQATNILLPPTGAHIHEGGSGVNGPVRINFNGELNGTLLGNAFAPNITPVSAPGFYVNVHTSVHPGGAIRGQLQYVGTANLVPEPETYALMLAGLGGVLFMARRRQRTPR